MQLFSFCLWEVLQQASVKIREYYREASWDVILLRSGWHSYLVGGTRKPELLLCGKLSSGQFRVRPPLKADNTRQNKGET